MPSLNRPEAPVEWVQAEPKRLVSGLILLLILAAVMVVTIPGFIAIGRTVAVKYCVSLAVLFLAGATVGFCVRISSETSLNDLVIDRRDEHRGTKMRSSRTLLLGIFLSFLALSIIAISAVLDFYANTDSGQTGPLVGVIIAGSAAVALLTFPLQVALRRIRPGYVSLSEDGIHHRGWTFDVFLPWSSFAGVKATYYTTAEILVVAYRNTPWRPHRTGFLWAIDKPPTAPMIELNCAYFKLDPFLMYQMLKFYFENPSMRRELGTEISIARAENRDYGTESVG